MSENEHLQEILSRFASEISEHFDSVRIFATKHGDGTRSDSASFTDGRGNYFAQVGRVKEWVVMQDEITRCKSREDWQEPGL